MKKLLKYISPFAPDQSGASAVLFELGGIIVICDAGGCTGNICGFDEPRWFKKKSAIFSAGLRDMDAILGRDEHLINKLVDTAKKVEANFAVIIGTPVPAVIATDYLALKRMAEKKLDIPVITVDTDGTKLYDVGEEKAYLELFTTFAKEKFEIEYGTIGVLGATPLSLSDLDVNEKLKAALKKEGWKKVYCYGMGSGLESIKNASSVEKNLVVSPSALKTAKLLEEKYGTPYETRYPLIEAALKEKFKTFGNKKILIVHQQIIANSIRNEIENSVSADVTAATWFMQHKELKRDNDIKLKNEDDFINLVDEGRYDVIITDSLLRRAIMNFNGEFIDLPHFAVSGRM